MFGIGEIQEHLARVEQKVDRQTKAYETQIALAEEQMRQLREHHTRVAALEERSGTMAAQLDARVGDVREACAALRAELTTSLDAIGPTLRSLAGQDKTRRGKEKLLFHEVRSLAEQDKTRREKEKRLVHEVRALMKQVAQLSTVYHLSVDSRFRDVAAPLVESRRTMLTYDRLLTLWQAAGNVARLRLPAVEVGTFQGGSAALIAQAMRESAGEALPLHVVDTFEGHLDDTFREHDHEVQRGKFRTARYDDVRDFLAQFDDVHVYQGDASRVITGWPERRYGLLHIDVDLYQPTLDCLEYFEPRLVVGGIIVVDDYEAPSCPGVHRAVHEYLSRTSGLQIWRLQPEQAVLIKTGA